MNGVDQIYLISINTNKAPFSVRMAREANVAMLEELVWDFHQGADKLWVHKLCDKYVR